MYKKILVPHAGTPGGDKALEHAIGLAKSSSGEIIILHVIEDPPTMPVFYLHALQAKKIKTEMARVIGETKSFMEEEMQKHLEKCKKEGVLARLKITSGFPAEEILRIITSQKIDIVVMSKRRKIKGIKSLLSMGSVSRKIVENTSCPVLLLDIPK
ncbi:MAG: universal stress protein [Nitrosopumilaceae archaeon]|nr:universal stress protein [Nitrosopumilaceae archaeon]